MAMVIRINSKLFDVVTTKMKILFYIGIMGPCSLTELRDATQSSWTTIEKVIPELLQDALIEITEEKSSVGGIKKIVKLSKKGEVIFNKLLELNDLLNRLDKQ